MDPYVVIQYENEEQKSTKGRPKTTKSRLQRCLCLRGTFLIIYCKLIHIYISTKTIYLLFYIKK